MGSSNLVGRSCFLHMIRLNGLGCTMPRRNTVRRLECGTGCVIYSTGEGFFFFWVMRVFKLEIKMYKATRDIPQDSQESHHLHKSREFRRELS